MEKHKSNSLGIASLVLGIVSIVFCWVPLLGLASGIVGIVCASKQRKIYPNGITSGGLVTSIIGVIFSALYNLFWIIVVVVLGTTLSGL